MDKDNRRNTGYNGVPIIGISRHRFGVDGKCNRNAPTTRLFFNKVQNKMHYAVNGHTAAELIIDRANAEKEHMGLTTWENAPNEKIASFI